MNATFSPLSPPLPSLPQDYDVIIVGGGISGSWIADELTQGGKRCLLLEAGKHYGPNNYPGEEIDANSELYWSGGIEFNTAADIGMLRPKVVGGGSIVNQALVDRFDEIALESWRRKSGISFLDTSALAPWYDKVEARISIQKIPAEFRNGNAKIFEEGFKKNGYQCAPLRRAQKDCKYEEGNDCIECLAGCRLQSKQSTPWTTIKRAQETGLLTLVSEFEVLGVDDSSQRVRVLGKSSSGMKRTFTAGKVVLASGAIGNSKLLLESRFQARIPFLGHGFYTHPQYMNLAEYSHEIAAHKGPFQAFKSDDPQFRKSGFKLENVFAPPVGISMLLPGIGRSHMELMKKITHYACIEVAIRDTEPGRIRLRGGRAVIEKKLNAEDVKRKNAGLTAVNAIFKSTGAKRVIPGEVGIGLHLMGGCAIGTDPKTSVVGPDFRIHGSQAIYAADSSIFPDAPGINPSLTIMALSMKAAQEVLSS
jgi:choline dehydrogenase-like flavoprotein